MTRPLLDSVSKLWKVSGGQHRRLIAEQRFPTEPSSQNSEYSSSDHQTSSPQAGLLSISLVPPSLAKAVTSSASVVSFPGFSTFDPCSPLHHHHSLCAPLPSLPLPPFRALFLDCKRFNLHCLEYRMMLCGDVRRRHQSVRKRQIMRGSVTAAGRQDVEWSVSNRALCVVLFVQQASRNTHAR